MKKRKFDKAKDSQTFSGYVPLQHFDRWSCTSKTVFLKLFIPSSSYTLNTSFVLPSLINHTQGSKFKDFYLMEVLNSWTKLLNSLTKQLYYDAIITFRILVKIAILQLDTQTIQSKNLTDNVL